jgi:hypothetical protein
MSFLDDLLYRASGLAEPPRPDPSLPPHPEVRITPPSTPQPVAVHKRPVAAPRSAYLSDMSSPLLMLSRRDAWTLRDACAGTHIFGSNASGKTTGSGQSIAKAFLRAGFGGLVLCAKPDERANWERYAKETGRSDQLIVVSPQTDWRFNFIQYELGRPGSPTRRVENLLSTFMNLLEQSGRQQSQASQEPFWQQAAELLLRNTLMVLTAARSHYSLMDVQRFIDSTPQSDKDTQSEAFQQAACYRYLQEAKAAYTKQGRQADYEVLENYFLVQFARLADRTRSSITITLNTMLQDLQIGTLRELFSTGTNFFPEDTHEGAIIILDLPTIQNRAHISAQTLFKVVWQQAALRRMDHPNIDRLRPIFLWADEAHFFATRADTDYQSITRAARACTVYLTQNLSAYYQRFGAQHPEHATHAFLGYLQTQIFHAQSDVNTIRYCQQLFGEVEVTRYNRKFSQSKGKSRTRSSNHSSGASFSTGPHLHQSRTHSFNSGSSDSWGTSETVSEGWQENTQVRNSLFASDMTALKTGAERDGISGAFVFQTGRRWANDSTILYAEFSRLRS